MNKILSIYTDNGTVTYFPGSNLTKLCAGLKKKGVYLIFRIEKDGSSVLVYIGKSGTYRHAGWGNQDMSGRIPNSVGQETRQQFFERMNMLHPYHALQIQWYATVTEQVQHLPAFTEALLIQKYFEHVGRLPEGTIASEITKTAKSQIWVIRALACLNTRY